MIQFLTHVVDQPDGGTALFVITIVAICTIGAVLKAIAER